MSKESTNISHVTPADFIEKIVGSKVTVIHGNDMEITGILRGYDTFVNLVMENVEITETLADGKVVVTKLDKSFIPNFMIQAITPLETKVG